jgi:hypothetical protein
MDFTFGIVTDGKSDNYILQIIESIKIQNIPNYEIIIIGNTNIERSNNIYTYKFDESIKPNWVAPKQNMIRKLARVENIVFLHDYISLDPNWYIGFLEFGNNFQVCGNIVKNKCGMRYFDYLVYPHYVDNLNPLFMRQCLLPYDFKANYVNNKVTYIGGEYYIMKKDIAEIFLLDENKVSGQGEDLELFWRLSNNNIIPQFNKYSIVHCLKQRNIPSFCNEIINSELLNILNNLSEEDAKDWMNHNNGTFYKNMLNISI